MFRKLASFSAQRYVMTLFAAAAGIALKSLIARTVGKEALGSYSYFLSLIAIGTSVLSFGLGRALTKQTAARQDKTATNRTNATVMAIYVLITLVLASIALLLRRSLSALDWLYPLVLIALGPVVIFRLLRAMLRGYLDRDREAVAILVEAVVRLIVVALAVRLVKTTAAPVLGLLGAYLLLGGMALGYTARWLAGPSGFSSLIDRLRRPEIHDLLRLTFPLWVVDVLSIASNQADRLIVQEQLGFAVLAEYAVAFTLIGVLDRPLTVLSRMFLATFAGGFYNHPEKYRRILAITMAAITSLGLLIIILAEPVVAFLFTDDYRLVPALTTILSLAFVFRSTEVLNTALTIAGNYPQANRNARLVTVVCYVPTAWILVRQYGVDGAAWSYVLSWGCYALVHLAFMARQFRAHAQVACRQILVGLAWYGLVITLANHVPNRGVGLLLIPGYLGGGHLLQLWNIREFAQLTRRLISPDKTSV